MGILPIRELARIPARDPTGDSDLPLPRLTGPRIKSNGKSKSCFALLFASARRTRALCSSRGPHGLAAAADDQAPQGCARRIARIPLLHRMCNQRNPTDDANPLGRMPKGRKALGRVSLVPFFARAKKGTRSSAGRVEALLLKTKQAKAKTLDSSFRGNDERESKDRGFRLDSGHSLRECSRALPRAQSPE